MMKALGIIGVVVGIVALILGAYLHFSVVPAAEIAESADQLGAALGDSYFGSPEHHSNTDIMSAKIDIGEYTLLIGGVAFLLSIVPAIKKQKIPWIGVVCGLFAFFVGVAYGTHMFS
ncbi:MAG: hypothetical protein ACJA0U_000066 [Salibacteraceae bacterium]|jgi:hypothetical protein